MPGSQAGASQDGAKDVAKRKATEVGATLEGERPTSRSRKSQGGESKKVASRATPCDSEKNKKETLRTKQSRVKGPPIKEHVIPMKTRSWIERWRL